MFLEIRRVKESNETSINKASTALGIERSLLVLFSIVLRQILNDTNTEETCLWGSILYDSSQKLFTFPVKASSKWAKMHGKRYKEHIELKEFVERVYIKQEEPHYEEGYILKNFLHFIHSPYVEKGLPRISISSSLS